jgi:hypothetical protein
MGPGAEGVHHHHALAKGPGHKVVAHIFDQPRRPDPDGDDPQQIDGQYHDVGDMQT